jgi:hypothetical protein
MFPRSALDRFKKEATALAADLTTAFKVRAHNTSCAD